MAKMGRPPIIIDWKEFDSLCRLQCTIEEMASFFDCSIETIENKVREEHGMTFSGYFAQKRGTGKISLRRKQFQTALAGKGNVSMLIWLGKQWLGQKDAAEFSGPDNGPIQLKYSLDDDDDKDGK